MTGALRPTEVEAASLPSGETAMATTPQGWSVRVSMRAPVAVSHNRTAPSSLPDNRTWPSGEKASARTGLSCFEAITRRRAGPAAVVACFVFAAAFVAMGTSDVGSLARGLGIDQRAARF